MSAFTQFTKMYENKKPISEKTAKITAAKEEEKKIAAMGLCELKDFACPKALQHKKDWYMTCVSCDGVNNCKPGRRVIEILENDTKPEERVNAIDKFNKRYNKQKPELLFGKEAYLDAIQHEDPIQYYMDLHHVTRGSALERFRRWRLKYPDIQTPVIEKKKNTNTGLNGEQNRAFSEKVRGTVVEAFTYPDGVFAYFKNVLDINIRSVIRGRVYNWANSYPDLNEKYRIKEWIEATRGTPGRIAAFDEPEGFLPNIKPPEKVQEPESDEVSVDDFLAEMESVNPEKVVDPKVDIVEAPKVDTVETSKVDTVKAEAEIQEKKAEEAGKRIWREEALAKKEDRDKKNRIAACLVFSEKRIEIVRAINERRNILAKVREELEDLDCKLKSLDAAAEIMGFIVEK